MEISENIYRTLILAQTCKIYVQKSASLLFELLMAILKALKSSDFFFFMLLLYLPILNSCNPVLAHHHNYSLLRVCLLAALNLNTSLKRQHRMKSLAKPPLTSPGMRPTGRTGLPGEAWITVIPILLSLWEWRWDTIWRPFYLCFTWHATSFLFCKITRKVSLLSASNKLKRLDESLETVLGRLGLQTAGVREGSPDSPLPAAQPFPK